LEYTNLKPIVLLEGWQLLELGGKPLCLLGFATGHPLLPGYRRRVRTSRVIKLDPANGTAETINTIYRLRHRVGDISFYGDGSVARFTIGDLMADRVESSSHWLVLRGTDVVADFAAARPVHAIFLLLGLVSP
jgi:hypothetical protein